MSNLIEIIVVLIVFITLKYIKKVPANTVYIIDRNTHYLKTVKKGFYFFNSATDKVTTKISINPTTASYSGYYETEDGKVARVNFIINYSADSVEDVLYNLEKTRRSIDDVLQGAMYHAIISMKSMMINKVSLQQEFQRNLEGQALPLCLKINSYSITYYDVNRYPKNAVTCFTPHKSRSLAASDDPIKY